MINSVEDGAKKVLELAYLIKPEKFAHLLVSVDVPEEQETTDDVDDGVDVKDPVQRAASVESVSPSDFKVVAALHQNREAARAAGAKSNATVSDPDNSEASTDGSTDVQGGDR